MSSRKIYPECIQEMNTWDWCKPCNSKHLQNDFNNWTSGNDKIDKFIQDVQLKSNAYWKVIEWMPYDRLKDVKQIVHQDFHPGNISSSDFKGSMQISGFGLSKIIGTNPNSPGKRIYLVYYHILLPRKGENKDSEIGIQIKKAEEFSANQESTNTTTTTPYQIRPQAIYTIRLNYSNFPKPKNEENFEREL
ncbi:hypothetical protein Glove_220g22 [Diversispora epigaea]|uniref:Protein kinase domain-containing protein n=1 Tax=Diversispora epigaea TaxID=1348612 RepID=A0A397INQ0_9GLOM|nr:hypothetical protein Glove_220g22 [Diversispora epigaea]